MEIEWQNAKNVAVTGKSKSIYLWSIDSPDAPLQKWEGHLQDVEMIAWDPYRRMLASCSGESYVCIWTPASKEPHMKLDKLSSTVNTIKWSNAASQATEGGGTGPTYDDVLLAAGCQDGGILIWNIKLGQLIVRLDTEDKG
jgi:WD40 repeat protein